MARFRGIVKQSRGSKPKFENGSSSHPAQLLQTTAIIYGTHSAVHKLAMNTKTEKETRVNLDELVEKHYEPVFRFANRLSGSPEAASDLTRQAFCLALINQSRLRQRDKVRSWLLTLVYRACARFRGRTEYRGSRRRADRSSKNGEKQASASKCRSQLGSKSGRC